MALISAKTILISLSLFHITLGFFLITNPGTVADQALVFVLGEATGMPYERSFESRSPASAFLGIVLAIWGATDFVTLSMPDEISLVHHWGIQAPIRFILFFALLIYTLLFNPASSPFYSRANDPTRSWLRDHPITPPSVSRNLPSGLGGSSTLQNSVTGWGGDELKNRVFFVWTFVETMAWLWAWVTLREETHEMMKKRAKRRGSQGGW
ncbi:increased loss of mitochondrial DNA protein 1 [Coniella lustricola]|uniref:Increased loss of mitochondrial DNA protein 1 n=1 Tax=Coniella lustricola TaxID=2025994 RepID=A0A2T3A799_9PEZI|nr:increased loss of mitochondrial DNA protein 1 [Coniella lustricola]